jgi:hypothetical protein
VKKGELVDSPRSEAQAVFLLCEFIRPEEGGRLTVIGLYPGNQVLVPKNTEQISLPLTFAFTILEGEGTFSTKFSIQAPSGKQIFSEHPLPDSVKSEGQPLTVSIFIQPFTTEEVGDFAVTLHLGNTSFRRTFTIGYAAPPPQGGHNRE